MEQKKKLSRKDFLRISGSLIAGGTIAGVSGRLIHNMVKNPDRIFYDAEGEAYEISDGDNSVSPYRKVLSVKTDSEVEAFDLMEDCMAVAGGGNITLYSCEGDIAGRFAAGRDIRDLCIYDSRIYVLYPARVEVFDSEGIMIRGWDACSDNSDYCSLAVTPSGIFVTDVFAKNICKYNPEGGLERFIESPNGFVVPSYSFGIAALGGTVYCSNPGRHMVEVYSENGEYLSCFGQAGTAAGSFSGCCNPVHLHVSDAGEIITSEKGIPRICCYSPQGRFRSVLLNRKALGGGYDAYEARITRDGRIATAGRNSVSIYRYEPQLARGGACDVCGITGCPIRRGMKA